MNTNRVQNQDSDIAYQSRDYHICAEQGVLTVILMFQDHEKRCEHQIREIIARRDDRENDLFAFDRKRAEEDEGKKQNPD